MCVFWCGETVGAQVGVSEAYAGVSRLGTWSAHLMVDVGSQQPYGDLVGCERDGGLVLSWGSRPPQAFIDAK